MRKLIFIIFLALVSAVVGDKPLDDTSADVKCYVCMGRDSDNCVSGEAHCTGYCYKVLDGAHDLIAKGCTTEKNLPTLAEVSDWSPNPNIELYWTKTADGRRDHVRGRSYFCNTQLCNAATKSSFDKTLGLFFAFVSFVVGGILPRL